MPAAMRSRSGSKRSNARSSLSIVVDSPPGMTSPSTASSSRGGARAERRPQPARARQHARARRPAAPTRQWSSFRIHSQFAGNAVPVKEHRPRFSQDIGEHLTLLPRHVCVRQPGELVERLVLVLGERGFSARPTLRVGEAPNEDLLVLGIRPLAKSNTAVRRHTGPTSSSTAQARSPSPPRVRARPPPGTIRPPSMPPPGVNQKLRSGRCGSCPRTSKRRPSPSRSSTRAPVALDSEGRLAAAPSVGLATSHALRGGAALEPLRR